MIDGDPAWVSINPERAQESKRMLTDVHLTQALMTFYIRSTKHRSRCAVRSEGVCVSVSCSMSEGEGNRDRKLRDAGRQVCESESPSPYLPPTLAIFTVYLTASSTTAWTTHTHTHTPFWVWLAEFGYFDLNLHTDIWIWPESVCERTPNNSVCLPLSAVITVNNICTLELTRTASCLLTVACLCTCFCVQHICLFVYIVCVYVCVCRWKPHNNCSATMTQFKCDMITCGVAWPQVILSFRIS